MIDKMIEGFEATCYELSDEIKTKLLASDPDSARGKIMDLYACRLAGIAYKKALWERDPKRPEIKLF